LRQPQPIGGCAGHRDVDIRGACDRQVPGQLALDEPAETDDRDAVELLTDVVPLAEGRRAGPALASGPGTPARRSSP